MRHFQNMHVLCVNEYKCEQTHKAIITMRERDQISCVTFREGEEVLNRQQNATKNVQSRKCKIKTPTETIDDLENNFRKWETLTQED